MLGLFDEELYDHELIDQGSSDSNFVETRHVVTFSRNFKIDESDYLTMEEILRDTWSSMEENGFYCETTLDATRMLVETEVTENEDNIKQSLCKYRIKSLKILPFVTLIPLPILKLDALVTLDVSDNQHIDHLPTWIADMQGLKNLNLSFMSGLQELPDEICQLKNLESLDLTESGILALPSMLHELKSLKRLILSGCEDLQLVHHSIGQLVNLQELDLYSTTKLEELPEEMGNLRKLKKLNLSYSNISELPLSMGKLKSLQELDLSSTKNLKTLPKSFCDLERLQKLNLSYSNISSVPNKICKLEQLEYLNLHQCRGLKTISENVRMLERSLAFKKRSTMMTKKYANYYKQHEEKEEDMDATIDVHNADEGFKWSEIVNARDGFKWPEIVNAKDADLFSKFDALLTGMSSKQTLNEIPAVEDKHETTN